MQLKGAIFDLDGTLLDSMKIWDTAGEEYLLSLGIQPRQNLAETIKDMSLLQSAEYFQREYKVDKSSKEIIDGINSIIEQFYFEKAELKDGVKDFLEYLWKKDVKMCIATATDRYLVEKALERCEVREYFFEILTCTECGCGKDKPAIYIKALEQLKTEKENTFVFEDALYAVKTAKEAGFIVAGVFDESVKDQMEVKVLADYYVDNFMGFVV